MVLHVSTSGPIGNTYAKYVTTHPLERKLVGNFLSCLARVLPSTAPNTILEVGVGEGEVSALVRERYPDATLVGLDLPDPRLVREWRQRQLTGVFADAAHLPLADASVELVLAIEVLEHVADPETVLHELLRVVSHVVVISVPREPIFRLGNVMRRRYLRSLGNTPGHVQHWSRRSFVRFVARHAKVLKVVSPLPWTVVVARP